MRITTDHITRLTDKAYAGDNDAHRQLEGIDDDINVHDARIREGLGLTPRIPTIDPSAHALLLGYLADC